MELKSDLSKAKVGDWMLTPANGWERVPIDIPFRVDGRYFEQDKYPTCFLENQVPQPYLDLFGPPPCNVNPGDRVWVWDTDKNDIRPRILKSVDMANPYPYEIYTQHGAIRFRHCASWNNGNPPVEQEKGTPALPSHS